MNRIVISLIAMFVLGSLPAQAGEDAKVYDQALKASHGGQKELVHMYYRRILRDFPHSPYARQALFSQGQFQFLHKQDDGAAAAFRAWLERYPDDQARLFAWMYLYQIAKNQNDEAKMRQFRQDILTFRQVGLVFKDSKEFKFRSPLGYMCRAVFRIDRVDFFVEERLFAQVSF